MARDSEVPGGFLNFLKKNNGFLVVGHKEPDGDCVGSQIVLASILQKLGKQATICSAGPFARSEIKHFEHLFAPVPVFPPNAGLPALILVDCSSLDRTGSLEPLLKELPFAVIDHHADTAQGRQPQNNEAIYNKAIYVETKAPSTTFLIYKLVNALGLSISREEAGLLFFGLCTDTGFFRHVDSAGAETFKVASALIGLGASPKDAYSRMYGGKSLDSRRHLARMLLRAELLFDGKLVLSSEEFEENCVFGLEGRDSESLYRLLQSMEGVEAIAILRQESPEICTVGFRSRDLLDVGALAASFGGGGHKNASGVSLSGTIDEIKPAIITAFEKVFKETANS